MLISWIVAIAIPVGAVEPDWSLYQQLLNQYLKPAADSQVSQGIELSWLDYSGLKQEPKFDQLLDELAVFSLAQLHGPDEKLAFYINAYNILAISLVRQHWPLVSIKQASPWYRSVWTIDAGLLDRQPVNLDMIEHQILRKMNEPRVHFAIVCASLSCPDLRHEPYRASDIDQQLDDQARHFINNLTKGVQQRSNGVYISKIFDWFESDFGGEQAVIGWINRYRKLPLSGRSGYLDYNWSVNGS